ncbi:hypothetical protein H632_c2131p0, partial [Helicosporidium sp. ATCC 50920]
KELVESLPSSPRGGLSPSGRDMLAGCLEKSDLVEVLGAPQAGSSAQECSICCDDYRSGDVLRVLPSCGHRFHLECVDRWFLSIADSDRAAACPLCNAPLSGSQTCRRGV